MAAATAHALDDPMVLTARAENHLHGIGDLDDTIARLAPTGPPARIASTRPGCATSTRSPASSTRLAGRSTCWPSPSGPTIPELESVGVRRVSTGSLLAGAAYAASLAGADELAGPGTSQYAATRVPADVLSGAFRS